MDEHTRASILDYLAASRQARQHRRAEIVEKFKAWRGTEAAREALRAGGTISWQKRKAMPSASLVCAYCERVFQTCVPHLAKFCSRRCRNAASYKRSKTLPRICAWCGTAFLRHKYLDKSRPQLHCSRRCASQHYRARLTDETGTARQCDRITEPSITKKGSP